MDSSLNNSPCETVSASSSFKTSSFMFPPAPRLSKSANSSFTRSNNSDSSASDGQIVKSKKKGKRRNVVKSLAPIGVFWDIENCQVPRNKNASLIVQRIRELFYAHYREAEFMVVCDVKKESSTVIQDLNDAQVNLIHVSAISKNAADDKLRQSLRRFAELHPAPSAVVLISSDVNFAGDLSDLRYRRKMYIILIHMDNVADALILCANETHNFTCITDTLPVSVKAKVDSHPVDLYVYNLPSTCDSPKIKIRLNLLCNNCGGKIVYFSKEAGTAVIRFTTVDFAIRAQRRIQGEDVCGNKISVSNPIGARETPIKTITGRKHKNRDFSRQIPSQTQPFKEVGLNRTYDSSGQRDYRKALQNQDFQLPTQSLFQPIRGPMMLNSHYEDTAMFNPPQCAFGALGSRNLTEEAAKLPCASQKTAGNSAVELLISNLDSTIQIKELRKILLNLLKQYAMVLSTSIFMQSDGTPAASVVVGSQQEAQFVISQLHHHWIGSKRISISYAQNNAPDPSQLGAMVVSLLQEVPGNRMPLFQFMELFEFRFHINVSVSDINKLRSVCKVTDEQGGRIITLSAEARSSPQLYVNQELTLYCTVHCNKTLKNRGWGESEVIQLPNIKISLKLFASKVHSLLASHMGSMPFLSFPICYEFEFGQPLPSNDYGVPLEHLVTCVPNVELYYGGSKKSIKYLRRVAHTQVNDPEEVLLKSVSPSLLPNINMLCREIVDLLKTTEGCQLLMSRFIPAYHNHFGRQCRVADYGFTRLIDLFEAISHVVQILNDGANRTITLTHTAQIRRFTSDLLRVLKVQVSKQVSLNDFPIAYEKVLNKPLNPVEYGLCNLEDLLEEVSENTVVITRNGNAVVISIPKREQTPEEILRTKQFSEEVVELLRHATFYKMAFNKFVPAYHHHFSRQCKVSEYGFTKLAELFEAIPDIVRVEGRTDIDKIVVLTVPEMLKVLGGQIDTLIGPSVLSSLHVNLLAKAFKYRYGYHLKPEIYECSTFEELVYKLSDYVQVINSTAGPLLVKAGTANSTLSIQIWILLLDPPYFCNSSILITEYEKRYNRQITLHNIQSLNKVVTIKPNGKTTTISLTPLYILAAELYKLLYENGGCIQELNLDSLYMRKFKKQLPLGNCRLVSIKDMYKKLSFLITIQGCRNVTIVLNRSLQEYGVKFPSCFNKDQSTPQWPHFPTPEFSNRRVTPPKPDTPPADSSPPWVSNDLWFTPPKDNSAINLSIPIPMPKTPKLPLEVNDLISPTRSLLPANSYPSLSVVTTINAPDPNLLPMPDKLLLNEMNDSGVLLGSRHDHNASSDNEMEISVSSRTLSAVSHHGVLEKTFGTFNE